MRSLIVFYSWQSDTDRKLNKTTIQNALESAIDDLNLEMTVTDRNVEEKSVKLDQDTKDVLGLPPIAETIMQKIEAADIIVSDVTLVAKGGKNKPHINSNVAIELGYALGVAGHNKLLLLMNSAFGGPGDLPFDLRNRRHPTTYSLPVGADKNSIKRETTILSKKLKGILSAYAAAEQSALKPSDLHEPEGSSFIASAFWKKDEPLGESYRDQKPLYCQSDHLVSVRIVPKYQQSRLTQAESLDAVRGTPPLLRGEGYSPTANRWGGLSYNTYHDSFFEDAESIMSGTQVFKSREIWMFSAELIYQKTDQNDVDLSKWFTHYDTIMRYLPDAISNGIELAKRIIEGEFDIHLTGATFDGVYVYSGEMARPKRHSVSESMIEISRQYGTDFDATGFAFDFANKIYSEAGISIPRRVAAGRHT